MPYLLARHKVADFSTWKAAYDSHLPAGQKAGLWRIVLFGNHLWALLVTLAAGVVCAKVPMSIAWPWILLVVILVFLGSLLRSKRSRVSPVAILTIGGAFVFLIAILSRFLFQDYLLTNQFDTWSYCGGAEYFTRFVRGTDPGIVPVYIFSAGFSNSRFGSFSMLAFLARVLHLDAVHALAFYALFLLCNIFWGIALLSRFYGARPFVALISGAFAVLCGLVPDVVIMSELDNLLFLSVFPFLIIRLQLFIRGNRSWSSIFGLALSASASFYSYPEGLAVASVIFFPVFIFCLVQILKNISASRSCLVLVGLFILLVAPYLTTFIDFLKDQLFIAAAAKHVGQGCMSGLISNRFLPSAFGSADEFMAGPFNASHFVLGVICLGFLAISVVRQRQKRRGVILASVFLLIICVIWQGLILRYDYGLFKFLVVGSILTTPLIFCGIQFASRLSWLRSMPLAAPAIALLVTVSAFAERRETKYDYFSYWVPQIGPYSDLARIKEIVGDSLVRLSFESGAEMTFEGYVDALDQLWASYFLRDANLVIPNGKFLLKVCLQRPPYRTWLEKVDSSVQFYLSNRPQKTAIWSNERFSLATERGP